MITLAGAMRWLGAACMAIGTGCAGAADLTLVLGDDAADYSEFVAQMQAAHRRAGADVALSVVQAGGAPRGPAAVADAQDDTVDPAFAAGGRTRSLRPAPPPSMSPPSPLSIPPSSPSSSSPPALPSSSQPLSSSAPPPLLPPRASSAAPGVLVAVGAQAARSVLERSGGEPVLLALLGRLEFESLRALPAMARGDRAIGVLLRDPPMAQQLALIAAVLPGQRRVGVVATHAAEPLLQELRRTPGWKFSAADASDPLTLGSAIRAVLPDSDALLVLPDTVGTTAAASLAVLEAAATARRPVFANSEAMVRAGALAAVVARPDALAEQAYALGRRLGHAAPGQVMVEYPQRVAVRTNPHVAQALGLKPLPDNERLAATLAAAPR
ncbi:hypothetical protein GCM10023144_43860 [Pigmentiphaga soli]|uniref:ABC transporter substrate-binding protein n=2 Tax=Pigmentiphaga soli TaxID=1007095 RepID=A0ABP8HPD8_9BURK